jgi:uncharacterized protein YggE
LVASVLMISVGATASAQEPPTTPSTSTTLAEPPGAPTSSDAETVTVTGTGHVSVPPDLMHVEVGVSVTRPTVAEAREVADQRARAVIDAVRGAGVAEADVQTANYSIQPHYRYPQDAARVLEGFTVTNTVRATVRDLANAGAVIDAAATAGGDEAIVSGVSFGLTDPAEAQRGARQEAWDDARRTAEQLAELAGRRLGPVIAISETSTPTPPPVPVPRAEQDATVPIAPGSIVQSVSITVHYRLT